MAARNVERERRALIDDIVLRSPPASGDWAAARSALADWTFRELRVLGSALRDGTVRGVVAEEKRDRG